MKSLSLLLIFILAVNLIIFEKASATINSTYYCHHYSYPFDHKKVKKVKCDPFHRPKPSKSLSAVSLAPGDAFVIDFHCGIDDKDLCQKAQNSFISVGNRIASIIQINTPIKVEAAFTDICKDYNVCSKGGIILGAAQAAQTIPIKDSDDAIRYYPQALVKQLGIRGTFNGYDISAVFNSQANMYFKDNSPIKSDQFDFESIVTHEFIHGLGFFSYWREYNSSSVVLTPYPEFLYDNNGSDQITFTGFHQTVFDRYMSLTEPGKPPQQMTQLISEFNNILPIGTHLTVEEFIEKFQSSQAFDLGIQLAKDAVTPKTMNFITNITNDEVLLETKINPFTPGSSISHVDTSYNVGPDFLMMYAANPGITLDDLIAKNGGTSAIGPNLINILRTLGYSINGQNKNDSNNNNNNKKIIQSNSGHGIKYSFFYNTIGVFVTIILWEIMRRSNFYF